MTQPPWRFPTTLALATLAAFGLAAGIRQRLQPVKVAVGVDRPLVYGAAVDPTDLNTAQHFLEQTQDSMIRLATMFNHAIRARGATICKRCATRGFASSSTPRRPAIWCQPWISTTTARSWRSMYRPPARS